MGLPPGPRAAAAWQTMAGRSGRPPSCSACTSASRRPGHAPHLLDRRADGAVLAPRTRSGRFSASIRRSRQPQRAGVPAPVARASARSSCSTETSTCASGGSSRRRSTESACAPSSRWCPSSPSASSRAGAGGWATLERMRDFTLETILRIVFGARGEEELGQLREAVHRTLRVSARCHACWPCRSSSATSARAVPGAAPLGGRALRRAAPRSRCPPPRRDPVVTSMLALLLEQHDEDGNPPTDHHLRDQLVALLAAGHDTSSASLG